MITTCCAKVTFATETDALTELEQMDHDDPRRREARVYRCRYGAYHLTSRPGNDWVDRPVGELVLQPGRLVKCPWCGRTKVLVLKGRILSGHRDLKYRDLPICLGVGKKAKYNQRGEVVKDEVPSPQPSAVDPPRPAGKREEYLLARANRRATARQRRAGKPR